MSTGEHHAVVIVLTEGKSDNGRKASLAFSAGLASLALGMETTIFLTSDGAIWGYEGSADGITVQGFVSLDQLIEQFLLAEGRLLLCSTCHMTCGPGRPDRKPAVTKLAGAELGGLTAVLELASRGTCLTF